MEINNDKIFSISEFIAVLNSGLKEYRAKIIGEVGEAKSGPTGHMYFTLKDEKDGALLNCIIWRSRYNIYGIELKEGMKIMASGAPEVYAPSGRLSFIADTIEIAGEGALKKEYERLKKKLFEEGIFEESRKRPIPKYSRKIGLVTSRQGAVLADFLNNLGQFGFKVMLIDSRVEGQEAVEDLLTAVKTFKKKDIEVLVIMRGGGSLEAMAPFNNEVLVREIVNFKTPVIAAIGHDKDMPLLAMAADLAVSTPTAAANYLGESWQEGALLLTRYEREVIGRYEAILDNYKAIENELKIAFMGFKNCLANVRISLINYLDKSFSGFRALINKINEQLKHAERITVLNNPERQLKLGYSIASINGKIIRKVDDAKAGDELNLKVSDGVIISQVKK